MSEYYSFTPKVQFAEPFSTLGNLCFWAAGVGLYVLPFLSFERLPAQAFGAGMLLVLLGGCSGAFHADGSRPGTWRHATDRIMMYALVVYLGVISFGGLWQAFRGHSASPRSWVGLTVNLLAPFAVVVVVLYQEEIDTKLLYLVIYPIILLTNGMIAALLKPREARSARVCAFVRNVTVQLGVISVSFYINLYRGVSYLNQVIDDVSPEEALADDETPIDIEPLPAIEVGEDTFATLEYLEGDTRRRELRRLHDLAHGTSHFLNAITVAVMVLTVVEGYSGRQRQTRSLEGMAAQALTCVVAALMFTFALIENSTAWLALWVSLEGTALPLALFLLWRTVRGSATRRTPAGAASVEVQTDELMALRPSTHRRARSDPNLGASWATALREWKSRQPLGSEEEQQPLCEPEGAAEEAQPSWRQKDEAPSAQSEAGVALGGWPQPLHVSL